jgi:hypothetical protein
MQQDQTKRPDASVGIGHPARHPAVTRKIARWQHPLKALSAQSGYRSTRGRGHRCAQSRLFPFFLFSSRSILYIQGVDFIGYHVFPEQHTILL